MPLLGPQIGHMSAQGGEICRSKRELAFTAGEKLADAAEIVGVAAAATTAALGHGDGTGKAALCRKPDLVVFSAISLVTLSSVRAGTALPSATTTIASCA